jgi:hypothetical protein
MKIPGRARAAAPPTRNLSLMMSAFVAVSAVCMMITSCAALPGHSSTRGSATARHRGSVFGGTNWVQPLPGGVATTVASVQAQAGFAVPMPNDPPAASQANLTQTWVVGQAKQVALVFDQGTVDIEMWPWAAYYPDPATMFQQVSGSVSATTTVGQVNGQPALVIQPHTDYIRANRAWVEFDLNGIDINISSDSYGTDVLLQIADSMQ